MLVSAGVVSQCGELRKGQMTKTGRGTATATQTGRGASAPLLPWNYAFITSPFFLHRPFLHQEEIPNF